MLYVPACHCPKLIVTLATIANPVDAPPSR
jgi:hypothetical protein